eukprot:2626831-Prymnesium_polylepis.1
MAALGRRGRPGTLGVVTVSQYGTFLLGFSSRVRAVIRFRTGSGSGRGSGSPGGLRVRAGGPRSSCQVAWCDNVRCFGGHRDPNVK